MEALTTGRIFILTAMATLVTLAYGFSIGSSGAGFDEGGFGTISSIVLLALISIVNLQIWSVRRRDALHEPHAMPIIWIIIALGFAFLALDDAFMIHENLDKLIHRLARITETETTDRIDDFLIFLYGVLGAAALYFYRSEITRIPGLVVFLKVGFALMVLHVVFDTFSSGKAIEESVKLFCEAVLLSGFTTALRYVRGEKAAED